MSSEGVFPKVDNEDGYYASEVNNALKMQSYAFGLISSLMGNTEGRASTGRKSMSTAFDSDIASTKTNLTHRDFGTVGQYYSTSGAVVFESPAVPVSASVSGVFSHIDWDVFTVYDECDNSSIDAAKWPASSGFAETVGITTNNTSGTLTSADLSGYSCFTLRYELGGDTDASSILKLTDGTNNFNLASVAGNSVSGNYDKGEITVWNNWSTKKCFISVNRSKLDSSSGDTVYPPQRVDELYLNTTGWTSLKVDITYSDSGTATLHYLRLGNSAPATTMTHSVSADNGSNYTSMGSMTAIPAKVGTAGSTLKNKLTGTITAGEVLVINNIRLGPMV